MAKLTTGDIYRADFVQIAEILQKQIYPSFVREIPKDIIKGVDYCDAGSTKKLGKFLGLSDEDIALIETHATNANSSFYQKNYSTSDLSKDQKKAKTAFIKEKYVGLYEAVEERGGYSWGDMYGSDLDRVFRIFWCLTIAAQDATKTPEMLERAIRYATAKNMLTTHELVNDEEFPELLKEAIHNELCLPKILYDACPEGTFMSPTTRAEDGIKFLHNMLKQNNAKDISVCDENIPTMFKLMTTGLNIPSVNECPFDLSKLVNIQCDTMDLITAAAVFNSNCDGEHLKNTLKGALDKLPTPNVERGKPLYTTKVKKAVRIPEVEVDFGLEHETPKSEPRKRSTKLVWHGVEIKL